MTSENKSSQPVSSGGSGGQESVNVTALSIPQLGELKKQLTSDTNQLSANLQQLVNALQRFQESRRTLKLMKLGKADNPIMVPLTQSMYIPGKLTSTEECTIDIGTGFFVKRKLADAEAFLERKIKFLEENTNNLEEQIMGKRNNLETVMAIMNHKIQQQVEATTPNQGQNPNPALQA